jgi:hypothetical protein
MKMPRQIAHSRKIKINAVNIPCRRYYLLYDNQVILEGQIYLVTWNKIVVMTQ